MTSFKIFIGEEIRRFRLETDDLTYEKFTEKLRQNIPSYHLEMKTFYEDNEKDKIIFSCEMEFNEMIAHLRQIQNGWSDLAIIKIWIEDSHIPYFVKGTAEVTKMYTTGKDALIDQLEDIKPIQERITSALCRLFPDNKILPYNIPSFLSNVLSIKTMGVADVEVDISVDNLAQAINGEALRLMESQDEADLAKSKKLLESLQILTPDNPNVYYNLACTESLLKNVQSSVEQLKTAFKFGYSNLQHMYEDKDLHFLRLHQQYTEFVSGLLSSSEVKVDESAKLQETANIVDEPIKIEVKIEEQELEPETAKIVDEPIKSEVKIEEHEKIEDEQVKHERWGDQIEVLKVMGFQLEESVMLSVLDHHKGNVEAALSDML